MRGAERFLEIDKHLFEGSEPHDGGAERELESTLPSASAALPGPWAWQPVHEEKGLDRTGYGGKSCTAVASGRAGGVPGWKQTIVADAEAVKYLTRERISASGPQESLGKLDQGSLAEESPFWLLRMAALAFVGSHAVLSLCNRM
jgi:hypothetical protein